jgi:phage portal protein BeeE
MPKPFSSSIRGLLADGIKSLSGVFSGGGVGQNVVGGAGYGWQNYPGIFGRYAGSAINWDLVTADLMSNPTAYTCLQIISDNYCQGRIRVEAREPDSDKYQPDPDHGLLPILKHPNDFYSWEYLQQGCIASMHGQGDAYIGIERDGDGLPAQLYWLPYGVTPIKDKGSKRLFDAWAYKAGNGTTRVPIEDIIHIPLGADPARPGFGMSVARVLKQSQYILQQGDNYTANIIRNNGTVGAMISPKEYKDSSGQVHEGRFTNGKAIIDAWKSKTTGDKVGEPLVLDYPMDVVFPKNTPQDLAIDTILDRPEANVCAAMRVSILLVGAHGGRHSKTYANMENAETSLWEHKILPLMATFAGALTTHLLPQMGGDVETQRVAYDTSGIRPLQPDLDKLHERVRKDFAENIIDLYTAEVETKRVPDESHKGVYHYMLPAITDRATSVDTLVPPGLRPEGTLPGKQPAAVSITPQMGVSAKPLTMIGAGKSQDIADRLRRQIAAEWREGEG